MLNGDYTYQGWAVNSTVNDGVSDKMITKKNVKSTKCQNLGFGLIYKHFFY